ncbi:MAG TPA: outer membrane beta-barrel protein [Bryobacteraceae bacterium]|nr:outer membrane beta-barrel protein [Bryobacteraceae bacterium]
MLKLRASLICLLLTPVLFAKGAGTGAPQAAGDQPSSQKGSANDDLRQQVIRLQELVLKLQARVGELEKRSGTAQQPGAIAPAQVAPAPAAAQAAQVSPTPVANPTPPVIPEQHEFLRSTTIGFLLDGYYGYNFNNPIGRVNLLRAYDVSSNSFILSQADMVVDNEPDPENGKRWGLRLDFQFGQATETLQGNPANEPRPGIYQNIFQAYGTYVFPIGRGLTVAFGKFASSLGMEGNYAKDQINYSRSFWFDFLPFYHEGVTVNYPVNDVLGVHYWMVNGTQQTEPFNSFKDQSAGLTITPNKKVNWTINYYLGQEHPNVVFYPYGGAPPNSPTEQGIAFQPIPDAPKGKLHIFDTYLTWQATPKLLVAGEADYVIERLNENSYPQHTDGGAGYFQYQFTSKFALSGRAEYVSDRGGLFTGKTQAVKEATLTASYQVADGLLARAEWRSDFSNQNYFLSDVLGILKKQQNTPTVGVVWWFGGKKGAW